MGLMQLRLSESRADLMDNLFLSCRRLYRDKACKFDSFFYKKHSWLPFWKQSILAFCLSLLNPIKDARIKTIITNYLYL
jgi:hypothetical protein